MKIRSFLMLLLLVLALSGCGAAQPEALPEPTESAPATEAPARQETLPPETAAGTVKADKTAVMLTKANRGDLLDLAGDYDEAHYVVKLEAGYGILEKRLARRADAPPFESWEGYASYGAMLYPDYLLKGAGLPLEPNRKVTVLESLGDVLLVRTEEIQGYIRESQVITYPIPVAPSGGEETEDRDGGDISLGTRAGVRLLGTFLPQEGQTSGKVSVLADGVPILLGWFDRGETVALITQEGYAPALEGCRCVYLKGICGYVEAALIAGEGEEPYISWEGYAVYGAKVYGGYDLGGEPILAPQVNTRLQVLEDLGSCYLVAVWDMEGYLAKESVSREFQDLGGESGSPNGGDPHNGAPDNGAPDNGSSPEAEWSPPVL